MQNETMIKLKALHNNIRTMLEGTTPREKLRPILNFDPKNVLDIFYRYHPLRDELKSKYPSLFHDLPIREVKTSGTTDYQGRGYVTRNRMVLLLNDINYCLDILSQLTTVEIPSMKVTREGIFFAGQYFDALQRVRDIISNARQSIVIIDGYINSNVLDLVSSKDPAVEVKVLTKEVSPALKTAANAFNKQYGRLSIRTSKAFHDRFVFVDDREFYHFGASIKDLGHRGFMFSRIEEPEVINALYTKWIKEWKKATVEV